MRMYWPGFRKVRRQVCRRITRRIRELDLPADGYRAYLETHPEEWQELDRRCRITISRFYRDKGVFEFLGRVVLPRLAGTLIDHEEKLLRIWSAGCGSGEEPYSLALLWDRQLRSSYPSLDIDILGSDVDPALLERAQNACYAYASIRELPAEWIESEFTRIDGMYCLNSAHKENVRYIEHDVRTAAFNEPFDMIMCRNLVFTYFDQALQLEVLHTLANRLRSGGVLVIGAHENLPVNADDLTMWSGVHKVYRKTARSVAGCKPCNSADPPVATST